jgi:hypothetical protein
MIGRRSRARPLIALVAAAFGTPLCAASPAPDHLVSPSELCVTAGHVRATRGHGFFVDAAGMRAVVAGSNGASAEIAFTYHGPSSSLAPLANGEPRRQMGLKLRAKDTCNLVYVMWRLEPTSGIFVSVKHNPGMSTHAECGAGGYLNVKPSAVRPLPPIRRGEHHVLRADLDGARLRVTADGVPAWEGVLPPEALDIDGPAGVRSDNVAFEFDLRVLPSDAVTWTCPRG